jgi:hypothetical protein
MSTSTTPASYGNVQSYKPLRNSTPTLANMSLPAAWVDNPAGAAATFRDSHLGLTLQSTDFGSDNLNTLVKAVPTAPYFVWGKFTLTQNWSGDSWGGLVWRASATGKLTGVGLLAATDKDPHYAAVYSINFPSAGGTAGTSDGFAVVWSPTQFIGLADDGNGNVSTWISPDGSNFIRMTTGTKTAGFQGATGYDQIGVFLSAHGSAAVLVCSEYGELAQAPASTATIFSIA